MQTAMLAAAPIKKGCLLTSEFKIDPIRLASQPRRLRTFRRHSCAYGFGHVERCKEERRVGSVVCFSKTDFWSTISPVIRTSSCTRVDPKIIMPYFVHPTDASGLVGDPHVATLGPSPSDLSPRWSFSPSGADQPATSGLPGLNPDRTLALIGLYRSTTSPIALPCSNHSKGSNSRVLLRMSVGSPFPDDSNHHLERPCQHPATPSQAHHHSCLVLRQA
jgi:hypothetical protein